VWSVLLEILVRLYEEKACVHMDRNALSKNVIAKKDTVSDRSKYL
jgi:hypothetical protein